MGRLHVCDISVTVFAAYALPLTGFLSLAFAVGFPYANGSPLISCLLSAASLMAPPRPAAAVLRIYHALQHRPPILHRHLSTTRFIGSRHQLLADSRHPHYKACADYTSSCYDNRPPIFRAPWPSPQTDLTAWPLTGTPNPLVDERPSCDTHRRTSQPNMLFLIAT